MQELYSQRQKTMLERIGSDAADLIDDMRYLPFFRSIQIKLEKMGKPDEWARIIETAKAKDNPRHYFAKLCKMVRDGTYNFIDKATEVAKHTADYIAQKIQKFNFNAKYKDFWIKKCANFINKNGMVGFIHLMELADRKNLNQRYFAAAILNMQTPQQYFDSNF